MNHNITVHTKQKLIDSNGGKYFFVDSNQCQYFECIVSQCIERTLQASKCLFTLSPSGHMLVLHSHCFYNTSPSLSHENHPPFVCLLPSPRLTAPQSVPHYPSHHGKADRQEYQPQGQQKGGTVPLALRVVP